MCLLIKQALNSIYRHRELGPRQLADGLQLALRNSSSLCEADRTVGAIGKSAEGKEPC